MEWWRLALDYVKAFLTPQIVVVLGIIWFAKTFKDNIAALIDRIKAIKFPGGEVSTPQLEKLKNEKTIEDKTSIGPQSANLTTNVQETDIEALRALYISERKRAYFWEYSYLNYYLVPRTQITLDLIAKYDPPMSLVLYDDMTSPYVPDQKERQAIIDALEKHYLIELENDLIKITPKGLEYIEWRGKVHQPSSSSPLS